MLWDLFQTWNRWYADINLSSTDTHPPLPRPSIPLLFSSVRSSVSQRCLSVNVIAWKKSAMGCRAKVRLVKAMIFPIVMYGCESWTIKKADCQRSDAFELWCWRRLDSPLDFKKIKPVNPKGNQSWIFIGRTDAEDEIPILWPIDVKNWLVGKDSDAGKDWRWEKKGMTDDEMVGWHYWLDGHEFEQALGVGERLGSLACYSPWGHKESDTTDLLNWTELRV